MRVSVFFPDFRPNNRTPRRRRHFVRPNRRGPSDHHHEAEIGQLDSGEFVGDFFIIPTVSATLPRAAWGRFVKLLRLAARRLLSRAICSVNVDLRPPAVAHAIPAAMP